jgi:hypothetical protein
LDNLGLKEKLMKKNILVTAISLCLLAVTVEAAERKINRRDLPAAVEKSVVLQSQGATIRGFSEEQEHGQTYYEVQLMVTGHSKDVQMNRDGEITEIEEQVSIDSLPTDVKNGLQAQAGKGKLTKVESITKNDHLVSYEAQVVTGGKRSEVQVGPDGKPLNHEE